MRCHAVIAVLGLAIASGHAVTAQGESATPAPSRPQTRRLVDTEPKILIREHGFTTEPASPETDSRPGSDPEAIDPAEVDRARNPDVRTSADAVELTNAGRRKFDSVKISNPEHRRLGSIVAVVGATVVIFVGILVMYSRRRRE